MGYIRPATIKSQIETNTYLDIICQDVKDMHANLDVIVDALNNYTDTGKLNELDIHTNLAALRVTSEAIYELATKAKLGIEIHE